MKNFCDNCNNLLKADIADNELIFKCMSCYATYKSEPDDSLRYEESNVGNLVIFQTILNKAVRDNVNIREYIPCPNVNIIKQNECD
jgi:DNA-directed RNA polymerase subunit M/transcription elongation factor TFIIS